MFQTFVNTLPPPKISHYQILDNITEQTVIKINPKGYTIHLKRNYKPKEFIVFNANYFWNNKPIMKFVDDKVTYDSIWVPFRRYEFNIGKCIITGGPTLIDKGKIVDYNFVELFREDVYRRTDHVAIGETAFGKIIVGFFKYSTPAYISKKMLEYGSVKAIKLDGGKSAYLKFGDVVRGTSKNIVCAVTIY